MPKVATTKAKKSKSEYVALVYFHGMGSQRRYEETSRLIDSVDKYLSGSFRERGENRGMLAGIEPRSEPYRDTGGATDGNEVVTYIRTRHVCKDENNKSSSSEVRFYETYWAPIMARASSPRRVVFWIARQVTRPWITLRTAWQDRQRLRRSALADLYTHEEKWPTGAQKGDFNKLLVLYAGFAGLSSEREQLKLASTTGSFEQFRTHIAAKNSGKPDETARLVLLAEVWKDHYRNTELKNAFLIATILVGLALAGGFLVWSVLQGLQMLAGQSWISDQGVLFGGFFQNYLDASVSTAIGVVMAVGMALGVGKFLTRYMGDVEAWSTYEETSDKHEKRQQIIQRGVELLSHVLADERCNRVILVSHSLGTSIAHDTLLVLTRRNKSVNLQDPISGPVLLEKIRHFVTIASPIDKIHYFFESFHSKSHRYTRVVETLRGDIDDVPFARTRHPYAHWVNFWDEADVISGGLHSPVARKSLTHQVDNVHISNLRFPDPGAAHSAYFNNRTVISKIFEMTYLDQHSYEHVPMNDNGRGKNFRAALIGPGDETGAHKWFFLAALATPWVGLTALMARFLGCGRVSTGLFMVMIALIGFLAFSWLANRDRDNRAPL